MKSDFEDRLRPAARNLRELNRHPMDWWDGPPDLNPLAGVPLKPSPWYRFRRWLRARFTWGWLR